MQNHEPQPPKWADAFLEWYCRPDLLEEIQGDINEIFRRKVVEVGAGAARRQYSLNVIRSFRLSTLHPGLILMKQKMTNILKGILLIPLGLVLLLIPYSLLLGWSHIGWNLATSGLFWLCLVPIVSYYLPIKFTGRQDRFIKTTGGLVLFYTFMIFMIYSHYQSDVFKFMIFSALLNLAGVGLVAFDRKAKIQQL